MNPDGVTGVFVSPRLGYGDKRDESPLPDAVKRTPDDYDYTIAQGSEPSGLLLTGSFVDPFHWKLWNENHENRWNTFIWLMDARFYLELADLDTTIEKYLPTWDA